MPTSPQQQQPPWHGTYYAPPPHVYPSTYDPYSQPHPHPGLPRLPYYGQHPESNDSAAKGGHFDYPPSTSNWHPSATTRWQAGPPDLAALQLHLRMLALPIIPDTGTAHRTTAALLHASSAAAVPGHPGADG
ncbi:hypothetical protein CPB84DRAFT_1843834 [Gymnopilus junonius]|uniref:Uncharacterized protein n=1 Tax=Gymnopilus junonius TaxID=109634 RepID=A0A9P5TQJ6_GYMJU|nr:hypothetical protein CPB84DRAFT_1843834 [Gymnopilus junonius]